MELTKSELEIMDTMWNCGTALSRSDLLAKPHTWKDSSVHILLNGLLEKEAIRMAGLRKCRKTYGRVFIPTMSREEYWVQLAFSGPHKPSAPSMIAHILEEVWRADGDVDKVLELAKEEHEGKWWHT